MRAVTLILAVAATLLFGLISGFFYAFSVDVMSALDQLHPNDSIRAMQAINQEVRNPVFFITFFLTPVVGTVAALMMWKTAGSAPAAMMASAAALYLLAAFLPTALVNVPMNEALELLDVSAMASEAREIWSDYSRQWTRWNTARTVGSTIALALSVLAVFMLGKAAGSAV